MIKSCFAGISALALLLLCGCASVDKYKTEPKDLIYQADINGDNKAEIIRVKDKFDTQSKSIIEALKKNQMQVASFTVPGRIEKVSFVDLGNGLAQDISVHYINRDDSETVSIFALKNDKFRKVFTVSSNCGIETDYDSVLARIKVGKFVCNADVCSCADINDGEIWIWTGDRFLKER